MLLMLLMLPLPQLVLRGDVAAGRHGPADVGARGRRVPGPGLRHHPGRLRAVRAGGQQGLALHHQQDPVRRADQVSAAYDLTVSQSFFTITEGLLLDESAY